MRYTRLRRQIESGALTGTHGASFPAVSEKASEGSKKRKRDSLDVKGRGKKEEKIESAEGRGKEKEKSIERVERGEKEKEVVMKVERWSDFESSEEDSEDEVPLAKLRKARMTTRPGTGDGDAILRGSAFPATEMVGTVPPLAPNMVYRPLFMAPNWGQGDGRMWMQGGGYNSV